MPPVANDWLDRSAQLTFRFALDAIVKERRWFGDDFLYGCHAIGEGDLFPTSELARRVDLSPGLPVVATAVEGTSDGT
ncbi:hypothetical protein [Sphingomonas nostoxanthinifaciens]|uniref:hypothetical protein n=1 Tax=Sphingomonas nostoxanthinifaciens TaxID=2872652 RepID=UPI001CC21A96|nr:hypothetical protein [Sphingomonas nostoxanthinifaciens]UAK24041.1 hypothetical protein K8P63_17090 [Sphingomonas nostoxanthinifaciens]